MPVKILLPAGKTGQQCGIRLLHGNHHRIAVAVGVKAGHDIQVFLEFIAGEELFDPSFQLLRGFFDFLLLVCIVSHVYSSVFWESAGMLRQTCIYNVGPFMRAGAAVE